MDLNINMNVGEIETLKKRHSRDFQNIPETNESDPVDKIDVEDLIKDFKILNVNNLSAYLKELWKDLADRSDNRKLGVNKITFAKFFNLPGLIFERLFAVFDKNQNEYLDVFEFLDGMMTLFSESFEKLGAFIFSFYDFDKDGYISKEDIRVVLSYIPLNESLESKSNPIAKKYKLKLEKDDFKDRVESQDELYSLLEKCFQNFQLMDYQTFLYVVENVSSEIFLYILIFLLEKRPFNKKTLEEFEGQRKNNTLFKITKNGTKTPNPRMNNMKRYMIASPNLNSKFSPSVTITKSPYWKTRTLNNLSNEMGNLTTNKYSIFATSTPQNKHSNFLNKLGLGGNTSDSRNVLLKYSKPVGGSTDENVSMKVEMEGGSEENYNQSTYMSTNSNSNKTNLNTTNSIITDSDQMLVDENVSIKNVPIFRKHRNNLKNLEDLNQNGLSALKEYNESDTQIYPAVKYVVGGNSNNLHVNNSLMQQDKSTGFNNSLKLTFTPIQDESDEEAEDEIHYEGYLYKISRGKKLKKRYFKLIDKDLYHYRNKTDSYHKGLHNLSGVFIQEGQPLQFNEFFFYSFSMNFNGKIRIYYSDNENDYNNWVKCIKKATEYLNLNDYYELKEKLGNGKFGMVRLGTHKENGRKVAIKIMNKADMTISDLELIKTEIEILKVAQHPYIIRIYDVYENANYIYIIMEHCAGGDLFSYIEKRQFKLPEQKACSIIHKLATAVYYLHSYGITHRDLKPENILMTDNTDDSDIKLVDFGLSKIIGPNETCNEPFGTLSYVAPEVLLELPYNKSVDMWSLGIITYLLLTGCLPFDDEHSEREVARKTIHEPVPFPSFFWKNISLEAKDFVTHLLQKDPSRRMTIKQVLEHPWIQKYNHTILPGIRQKSKDLLKYSTFKIYTTTEEFGNMK